MPVPVGVFIDLDNVKGGTFAREDAQDLIEPVKKFADSVGVLQVMHGFANLQSRKYESFEERQRRKSSVHEYDAERSHSGRDEEGVLRCGVCGQRMVPSKKKLKAGLTPEKMLQVRLHPRTRARAFPCRIPSGTHSTLFISRQASSLACLTRVPPRPTPTSEAHEGAP